MCTNYRATAREKLFQEFEPIRDRGPLPDWSTEVYRDGLAPIIVPDEGGGRRAVVANYSFVPKRHLKGRELETMNARGEEIHQKPNYKHEWKRCQLCLIPSQVIFEPFWEHGVHQRFAIGMADGHDFCVAGLWREWQEDDGTVTHAFTQITLNADSHPTMKLFHRPYEEKRGVVILSREVYDDWLHCKDSASARDMLQLMPADRLRHWAAPKPLPPSPQMALF
jgi:putative SOS response-associated peptidase YedK